MHKYMSAIGFHDCSTKHQLDDLIVKTISHPDMEKNVVDEIGRTIFQISKAYAKNMGLSVIGEIDNKGFRNVLFSFPYILGDSDTQEDEIQLQKFAEKDAYAGISEDYNLGVSLIFYLINISDYVEKKANGSSEEYHRVKLSALSTEGKILFGIEKNEIQIQQETDGQYNRNNLIQAAKNGDMDAIENLTLEDIDTYSLISRRALTEDIYSIVDTTFMPYGVESDQYSIIGNITNVEIVDNVVTKEQIYILDVDCNEINIVIGINKSDLVGVPKIGYRFKGNIWLQGLLDVNNYA